MVLFEKYLSNGTQRLLADSMNVSEERAKTIVGYLTSVHDIGKAEFNFQIQYPEPFVKAGIKMDEMKTPNVRHEKTGKESLRAIWKSQRAEHINRMTSWIFSGLVGAHHQGKSGVGNLWEGNRWFTCQEALEKEMRERFLGEGELQLPSFDKKRSGSISAILLGLIIMADWISSSTFFDDANFWVGRENASDIVESKLDRFFESSGLMPSHISWGNSFSDAWGKVLGNSKRSLQKSVEEHFANQSKKRTSLLLIESPMGEGKTEAGLYAATQMMQQWGKDGIYMALPTSATSNQMVGRVQEFISANGSDEKVRLLHEMAWLKQPDFFAGSGTASSWLKPSKKALLGQYAVGTIDQALLAAMAVNYGVLRLIGLANKVLIIDEIHAYDAFMSRIIVNLLKWCKALQIPVIMLSATLPPELKKKVLSPYVGKPLSGKYPLITAVDEDGDVEETVIQETSHKMTVRVSTRSILNDHKAIAELAVKDTADGGCVCVIMNTVEEARRVYSEVKKLTQDVLLFHSQFLAEDRDDIEQQCLAMFGKNKEKRPKRMILVATQVVEQSLDVDFDRIYTAIAPIDLIIQRIGRLFRHANTPRPKHFAEPLVVVLLPSTWDRYVASEMVYPRCLLKSAERLLSVRDKIKIPEDLASLVSMGYDKSLAPPDDAEAWASKVFSDGAKESASCELLLSDPSEIFTPINEQIMRDEDSSAAKAQTRLGPPSVRIAMVDQAVFDSVKATAKDVDGSYVCVVTDVKLAEEVMKKSTTARKSKVGEQIDTAGLTGGGLISGVRVLNCVNNKCKLPSGITITTNKETGITVERT